MPWTNPETFTAGQTLTAASMNIVSGNARMGNPVYTNEAARDAAITSPEEGMTAYLTAPTVPAATGVTPVVPTGVTTIYNGSVWVCVTEVGSYSKTDATTTSSSFVTTLTSDTTAVSVTLVTGTTALVSLSASIGGSPSAANLMSFTVSGATTIAGDDDNGIRNDVAGAIITPGTVYPFTGLTAGTNTFTLCYRTTSGTMTLYNRRLAVKGIA